MERISKFVMKVVRNKGALNIWWVGIIIVFSIAISSCVSIKSDYPTIFYYNLQQEPTEFKFVTVKGSLQIRNFTSNDEFYFDNIQTKWEDGSIQKYFYHRWLNDPPDLVTDFIFARMNSLKVFSNGVVKSNSILMPDFILEGNLIEFNSYSNTDNKASSNYVRITLSVNLIKRMNLQTEKSHIFHRVYSHIVYRDNNSVKSIPVAFGKCLSYITDLIIQDIQQIIVKESLLEAE